MTLEPKFLRLSGAAWPPGMTRVSPVDSVEHITELRGGNPNNAVSRRGPNKLAAVETFCIKRHAEAVMPDDLDEVGFDASEDEKITRVWVPAKRLLNLQSQARHPAAHVGSPD